MGVVPLPSNATVYILLLRFLYLYFEGVCAHVHGTDGRPGNSQIATVMALKTSGSAGGALTAVVPLIEQTKHNVV